METGIVEATSLYEGWLAAHVKVVAADLDSKHRVMAADPFSLLRGTFYRWATIWPATCPESAAAPQVLGVGDLHVENFGTWRDAEGRLVWGVNDFDEATRLPYTCDLVRLATSARLAIMAGHLALRFRDACAAIIAGYTESLRGGGRPMVLAEHDRWLRRLATGDLRDPVPFWEGMRAHARTRPSALMARELRADLPRGTEDVSFLQRRAGVGSLGRPRVVALGTWHGALIAREAKPLLPSAWDWAAPPEDRLPPGGALPPPAYAEIVATARRCPDPGLRIAGGLVVRRLAPDCSRVELASLPARRDEERLLRAMGFETGNVHLGTPSAGAEATTTADAILADLAGRPPGWLREAGRRMTEATFDDWKEWRRHGSRHVAGAKPAQA